MPTSTAPSTSVPRFGTGRRLPHLHRAERDTAPSIFAINDGSKPRRVLPRPSVGRHTAVPLNTSTHHDVEVAA